MRSDLTRLITTGIALAVGGITTLSCTQRRASDSVQLTDSAGITIATMTELPPLLDTDYLWNLEVVRAIHTQPGGEGSTPLAYNPRGGALLDDGTIVLMDNSDLRLVVIDAREDSVIARFGRRGSGPGEIRGHAVLFAGSDRTFWAADQLNQRVSRFTPNGDLVEELRVDASQGGYAYSKTRDDPTALMASNWYPVRDRPNTYEDSLAWLDLSSGRFRSVIPLFRAPNLPDGNLVSVEHFYPRPLWTALHGGSGIVTGRNDRAEYRHFSDDGELLGVIRLPLSARPVTEQGKRDFLAYYRDADLPPQLTRGPQRFHSHFQLAMDMIAIDDTIFAVKHGKWSRAERDADPGHRYVWRLISVTGRYAGAFIVPENFRIFWVGRGRLLGAILDTPEIPVIEELALIPPRILSR